MSALDEPVLFLSTATLDGVITTSPLFAAVQVTATLVRRLLALEPLCERYGLLSVRFLHDDPAPVYWEEAAGSRMDSYLGDHVEWCVTGATARAILHGQLRKDDGGYGPVEPLAWTWVVDLAQMNALRKISAARRRTTMEFVSHEGWAESTGEEFALAVFGRIARRQRRAGRRRFRWRGGFRDHQPL